MKNTLNIVVISSIAVATIAALGNAMPGQGGMSCCANMTATPGAQGANKPVVAKLVKGVQKSTVTINDGYSPSSIQVKAGTPVELTFVGGKHIGCGGTVVFKSLKISKDVASGKSVVVKFTPKAKGDIAFTCGMGMLQGKVVVK